MTETAVPERHRHEVATCHDIYDAAPAPVVVVGVDGSADSVQALRLAATEARRRGATMHVVLAYPAAPGGGPAGGGPAGGGPADRAGQARAELERLVREAFARTGPPAGTRLLAVAGGPGEVLSAAAAGAELLVVGAHGHSAGRRSLLGSTARACAERAGCPVLIAPRAARAAAAQ